MAIIEKAFDDMFATKQVPIQKKELANDQYLYSGGYKLAEDKVIPFHIVARDFKDDANVTEYQITYRKVCQVEDFNNTNTALQVINELNQKVSGYYILVLSGDGEIYLRMLSRTMVDVQLVYEVMVFGSSTARRVYPILEEKINGKKVEVLQAKTAK